MKKIIELAIAIGVATGLGMSANVFPAPSPGGAGAQGAQNNQGQSANPPQTNAPAQQGQAAKPGQQGQPGQPAPPAAPKITPEEAQAAQAVQNELDPDHQIQLADTFAKTYPTSPLLTDVYFFEANAYRMKKDSDHAIEYGRKSLKANQNNLRSLLLTAQLLTDTRYINAHAVDKGTLLTEAETDAQEALDLAAKMQKQPTQTDDQFKQAQSTIGSMANMALGMAHEQRAVMIGLSGPDPGELAKAENNFKECTTLDNPPDGASYYRLGETLSMENKVDDAIAAFSKAGQLWQGTPLQAYADQRVDALKKQKAQSAATPKP